MEICRIAVRSSEASPFEGHYTKLPLERLRSHPSGSLHVAIVGTHAARKETAPPVTPLVFRR